MEETIDELHDGHHHFSSWLDDRLAGGGGSATTAGSAINIDPLIRRADLCPAVPYFGVDAERVSEHVVVMIQQDKDKPQLVARLLMIKDNTAEFNWPTVIYIIFFKSQGRRGFFGGGLTVSLLQRLKELTLQVKR